MILTISYQNKETRVINLHPSFFTTEPIKTFNKKSLRIETRIETPSTKATELAHSFNPFPYSILLERGGGKVMSKIYLENRPAIDKPVDINEVEIKKKLRNEFKNVPFTETTHL